MRSRIDFKDKNLIERGFTLVELLVVIVILGVLAAVVVFAVGGISNTSAASACKIEVRTINTANQAYYAKNNAFPTGADGPADIVALQGANLLSSGSGSASAPASPAKAAYSSTTGIYSTSVCTP